ncbi:MAG: hypothetical protein OEX22_06130 [Cyclobacteriaceae bacterium]|nr:hypothetical protein [Cyclobacteriaceae bacterium]
MKLIRKTASLFFLSIFSLLTLHQVLPHVHHEHEGFEDTVGHIEDQHHSHENGHHHHDDEENNNQDFDFLGFLLGNHVHSISTSDIQTVKNVVTKKVVNKNIGLNTFYELDILSPSDDCVQKFKFGWASSSFGNKIYLSTSFLRGPPALG